MAGLLKWNGTGSNLHKISEGPYGNFAGDPKYNSCIYIAWGCRSGFRPVARNTNTCEMRQI